MAKLGTLPCQMINEMVKAGHIQNVLEQNIRPASVDLRLSEEFYRVDGVFLPRPGESVREIISKMGASLHDLNYPLERGTTYLARLEESLKLPPDIYAYCNPKSSTGRNDIHVRVIADRISRYDTVAPAGYAGELWMAVEPRSFPIKLKPGVSLSQIRFFNHDTRFDEKELEFDSISIKYKNLGENIVEVKSGDNLSTIAAKNGVKIDNLKAWNNLKNNTIRIGQKLKIELKPEQIELLDLIGKLYDSEEKRVEFFDELLFLNPAINLRNGLYDDIKNALINGNGSGLKISLPENYNLRLPKGLAPEILTIYANSLRELPEKDLIVEYRKQITEEAAIAQVTTETGSRARKLLEEFNINFDSSKAADSGLILELNRISGILDKELQTGVVETQEQYDEIKVAINEKREEIRILIAQTLKTGLEVDTSSDYLVKLNERYENADKENITELSEIITLYEKELEKAAKVSELQAQVVEKLNELQADLEKIIEKSVDEIVEGNYFETGAEFPAQLQEKLTIANDNAIRLSAYTNKNVVMSANAVQSINKITQEKEKAKVLKDRQIAAAEPKKETIKPAEAKTGKQDEKTVPETAAMKSVKRPESTSKKGITKKRGLKLKVKPGWDLKQLQICYNVTREELYKTNPKLHRLSLKDSREIIVPVDYIEHTVKQGEGFIRIAGDYGVTLTSIYNANYGVKDETLRPGQKLIIVLPKTPKKH